MPKNTSKLVKNGSDIQNYFLNHVMENTWLCLLCFVNRDLHVEGYHGKVLKMRALGPQGPGALWGPWARALGPYGSHGPRGPRAGPGPWGPGALWGPWAPLGPHGPWGPMGPMGSPGAPWAPWGPWGPMGPMGPQYT